ncbi:hypothetical protein CNBF3530 [Cryptococcus deneoformans B-3501A]|uniref:Expressed protein n=1 Tax=Cryptococcus deneoformans (strain JEC21 / ATCC MYA-565) TaxID=214684 RepID=Q5KFN2_CRYD1|nr:expressed protein [Cryptococcus neoformans var. neoformans JEC21]XP_774674.1 hypothetical protein CNBF3530 [Cryptococcus neoformans var. neoformans B-3501A]AAW44258.1 expressed protein [Cryptococcus neoformans var. neoformans JEC21]EAL20027.1 hypothetical protein CNBF3530 [Cryptococcus neoformans var. neoformans B-3501A]
MKYAVRLLNEASESIPRIKPRTYSVSQFHRMHEHVRPRYLLLNNIPRTALPSDILRALRDGGAVDSSFPVTAITSPAPSLPRTPSLTRTWHLTTPSQAHAEAIYSHLQTHPLFSTSTGLPSGRQSNQNPNVNPNLTPVSHVQFTSTTPKEWINGMIEVAKHDSDVRAVERGKAVDPGFTTDWVLKPGFSGRRVIVKGLPGGASYDDVKRLAKDCNLVEGPDSCKRLPPSKFSLVSSFCLTVDSVADAYRLVRKIHMKWYKSKNFGEKYLMRAEVAY